MTELFLLTLINKDGGLKFVETEKDLVEILPSDEISEIEESADYQALVSQVENVNVHLDNITNLGICVLVGLGILVGVLSANIFGRYLKV